MPESDDVEPHLTYAFEQRWCVHEPVRKCAINGWPGNHQHVFRLYRVALDFVAMLLEHLLNGARPKIAGHDRVMWRQERSRSDSGG